MFSALVTVSYLLVNVVFAFAYLMCGADPRCKVLKVRLGFARGVLLQRAYVRHHRIRQHRSCGDSGEYRGDLRITGRVDGLLPSPPACYFARLLKADREDRL